VIIDCLSDLHGSFPKLDGGDLLILGGDYTGKHTQAEFLIFRDWLKSQDYKKKIIIGGNHDIPLFDGSFYFNDDWLGATWLNDSGCEFEGLKIWGSPWTSWFEGINPNCKAWTLKGDAKLSKKWDLIPQDTDILITHSPPYGIGDECLDLEGYNYQNVGSKSLLAKVQKIKPKAHIFGHIHEGYGHEEIDGTHFINASHMNESYMPANKAIRLLLNTSPMNFGTLFMPGFNC
jgi:Icc-related predicted phosphoesterase